MSLFLKHQMDVQESCNEATYVRTCVSKTELPGKFYQDLDLSGHGIIFDQDEKYKDFQECGVPVKLPSGYTMKGDGNHLTILDQAGNVVFSARVSDNRGWATWYKQ